MAAWNFHFPTATERILWRYASVFVLVFGVWGSLMIGVWDRYFLKRKRAARARSHTETESLEQGSQQHGIRAQFESLKVKIRNNSLDTDPAFDVPLSLIIPVTIACAIYAMCRAYILLEDILTLRQLPTSAFTNVSWFKYLPHI